MEQANRIPVCVITGFLGSGKTTLLNHLLTSPELGDAAVIVNEFGEIGIDHELIASSDDQTIELTTGCLCCTVQGDLVNTLRELYVRRSRGEIRRFGKVVIETTGLADPAAVIQALMSLPAARQYRLARVITTADAVHGTVSLDQHAETVKQAAVADEIIITKVDLAPERVDALASRLRQLNPGARLHRAGGGTYPALSMLFDTDIYDPQTKPQQVAEWLNVEAFERQHDHHHHSRHNDRVGSFALRLPEPVEWEHLAAWLDALILAHPAEVLRIKGIVAVKGRERPILIQCVQTLFHPPVELADWPPGERESRIVFILRDLSEAYVREVYETISSRPAAVAVGETA